MNKGKGDAFMILGATLYGFSVFEQEHSLNGADGKHVANLTEEFFARRRPLFQVVGQLGMWGTIVNGAQASLLEHNGMKITTWSGCNSLLFYPCLGFVLYYADTRFASWAFISYTAGAKYLGCMGPRHANRCRIPSRCYSIARPPRHIST